MGEKLSDPEEKLIIFAHHLAVISGIEEALSEKKFGHATVKIIGATPAMERTDNVERFQNQETFIYVKNGIFFCELHEACDMDEKLEVALTPHRNDSESPL